WVLRAHQVHYALWMVALIAGIAVGGDVSMSGGGLAAHWMWALWTLPMFASGPFVDQQSWQRWFAADPQRWQTWARGAVLFSLYMILVGLAGVRGLPSWSLAVVAILVAVSTLDSAM